MASSETARFSLAERFEHGNFLIPEILELKPVSRTQFYEDVKAGLVTIEKHGRRSHVRGPVAKHYVTGDPGSSVAA